VNRAELYGRGALAVEGLLLDLFGVRVTKALNPLDAGDFITISLRLSSALRGATAGAEGKALRSAIETLDVDWPALTDAGRERIIGAARAEVEGMAKTVAPKAGVVLDTAAARIIPTTRKASIDRFKLDIPGKLSDFDNEASSLLRASQMVYIKDQYGQRADVFDSIAKDIVASGLERGLGRDDISGELATTLAEHEIQRSKSYWSIVSTDFANKARTATQLHAFGEAGIKRYRFDAILDEATSDICRLLHGRVFSVKAAGERTYRAMTLTDPEQVKDERPWVQSGKDDDGNSILYFERGGRRHGVAQVDRSAEGERDTIGSYSRALSNKALEAAGVTVPPLHGHCRSTITTDE